MRWLQRRAPEPPTIPAPPDVEVDMDAAKDMTNLAKVRDRRGRRLTRETRHAIAQNHFVVTFEKALR